MPRGETKHLKKYNFKPGKSGNPSGRPPNPIPNALKAMTRQSYRRIIKAICKGNIDEVTRIAKDPKTSALEVAVAASFLKAVTRGDYDTIEKIAVRVLGKVPDELIVKSRNLNRNLTITGDVVNIDQVKEALAELEAEI